MELLLLLGMSLDLGFMVLGNDDEDTDNSADDVQAGDDTDTPDPVDDTDTSGLTLADLAGPLPEPDPAAEHPSGEATDGDDVIHTNDEFYDQYNAGGGDDVVFGGDVGDVIGGGDGDDTLFGGGGTTSFLTMKATTCRTAARVTTSFR